MVENRAGKIVSLRERDLSAAGWLAEHRVPLKKVKYNQCVTKGQAKKQDKTVA